MSSIPIKVGHLEVEKAPTHHANRRSNHWVGERSGNSHPIEQAIVPHGADNVPQQEADCGPNEHWCQPGGIHGWISNSYFLEL